MPQSLLFTLYIRAMDSQVILSNIRRQVTLNAEEEAYLLSVLIPGSYKQGEFVQRAGETTRGMIHVNTGCLMTYYAGKEGEENVVQFATSGWWTGDLASIQSQEPSIYATRALADSTIFLLPSIRMEELLSKFPVFERYFRITYQNSLVTHQRRIIQAYSNTADERYAYFQQKYPQLEQYVPLKYVASYLGMTPEFLSKIRRKRMTR